MAIDTAAWRGLELVEQVTLGNRNEVWRGRIAGVDVAVRRSRRSPASLDWELDLIDFLDGHGFVVPRVITANSGARSHEGVVVQQWIPGREPVSTDDWAMVANELQRMHSLTRDYPQRPGCCRVDTLGEQRRSGDADLDAMHPEAASLVLSVFAEFADHPAVVVHGDVGAPNIRITPDGRVALLDWDESRVDVAAHDLSPLGVQVFSDEEHAAAQRLSHAWEAANGWVLEPTYARRRLEALRP